MEDPKDEPKEKTFEEVKPTDEDLEVDKEELV